MEQIQNKKPTARRKRDEVRIVVKPIYVGDQSMTEVFEKVAFDNIKSRLKTG